jgi:pyruvate ferredoxin oxidoreductase gamma subunit
MMMIEVRIHGRGGQGAKIASRILGRSGFLSGLQAQDFALFGAERRGAPVVSFTRLSATPIDQRGNIERPDLIVVMDDSLLNEAPAQIFAGVDATTAVIVNADPEKQSAIIKELPQANYISFDFDRLARETIGRVLISAIAAAVAAKSVTEIKLACLLEAVRSEIAEFGLTSELIEKNVSAAREAFTQMPSINIARGIDVEPLREISWQAVPYLGSAQFAGATIRHRGSAALRATGNWRVERPVVDLGKCKRCFLCYLYCPEAAMRLDGENFPHVDYEHCKGCMICYEECPTDAISRRPEV